MNAVCEPARAGDAPAIAAILSGWIDEVDWMPRVHAPSQYPGYGELLMASADVSVACMQGRVVGFLGRIEGEIQALYVAPGFRGQGIGTALLDRAKAELSQLGLWSFQANTGARRFYRRHGFVEDRRTDGQGNDEKLPDVYLVWMRDKNG